MTDCKHDWHFLPNTDRLQCRRCKAETGPRTYEQRVQDILTVPTGQLQIADIKPNYNLTFHNNLNTSGAGKQVGRLDFNGPELVFEGDAAESAKVFIDWVAQAFHGRLEQERQRLRDELVVMFMQAHEGAKDSHNHWHVAANKIKEHK